MSKFIFELRLMTQKFPLFLYCFNNRFNFYTTTTRKMCFISSPVVRFSRFYYRDTVVTHNHTSAETLFVTACKCTRAITSFVNNLYRSSSLGTWVCLKLWSITNDAAHAAKLQTPDSGVIRKSLRYRSHDQQDDHFPFLRAASRFSHVPPTRERAFLPS